MDYGLQYGVDCEFGLVGYTDSDWDGSVTNRKSTSGCCLSLRTTVIAWRSRKQRGWCFVLLRESMFVTGWRRELWRFLYIASREQAADMLTKPLSRMKLEYFRDKLGVVPRKRE